MKARKASKKQKAHKTRKKIKGRKARRRIKTCKARKRMKARKARKLAVFGPLNKIISSIIFPGISNITMMIFECILFRH